MFKSISWSWDENIERLISKLFWDSGTFITLYFFYLAEKNILFHAKALSDAQVIEQGTLLNLTCFLKMWKPKVGIYLNTEVYYGHISIVELV